MRLTRALQIIYKTNLRTPGHQYKGKHRIEARVTLQHKIAAARHLLFEQRNMECLGNPYLTEEEEEGYKPVLEARAEEERIAAIRENQEEKMFKNKYMAGHLNHLKVAEKWE